MLRKIALSLCFTLFLGLLTACGPEGILRPNTSESPSNSQPQKSENGKDAGNTNPSEPSDSEAMNANDAITAPIAIPPSFGNAQPGQAANAPAPADGFAGFQPMKGVNVDTLFAEKISDSDDRFERLENTVVNLHKEINNVMPSIIRLIAIESDIQSLTQELNGLLQEAPMPQANQPMTLTAEAAPAPATLEVSQLETHAETPPESLAPTPTLAPPPAATSPPPQVAAPAPAPVSAPAADKVVSAPKPAANAAKIVSNLRLGEYANKVRVVIDSGASPKVTSDYDPEEKLLVMEVMDAQWSGEKQKTFTSSKLIQSYSVSERADGKGVTIAITLKKDSRILNQGNVSPDENPNYRYYIDLGL